MCHISELTWTAIIAITAILSLLATIILVNQQLRFSERDLHVRMQLILDDKFNSDRIKKARKALAIEILAKHENPWEAVMEFFESMGLLLRRKSLDEEMIWATFSFYIIGWWEATKTFIETKRKKDDTMYSDFKILVEKMYVMEMKQRKKERNDVTLTEKDLNEFLNDEKDLK